MNRYRQSKLAGVAEGFPSGTAGRHGSRGEVFTRRWVVDLILDLVGYRAVDDLGASVVVEPACGVGAFLVPIAERLAASCKRYGRSLSDMGQAIRGFDLLERNVEATRESVVARLVELGERPDVAECLGLQWVRQGDFLLGDCGPDGFFCADFVVGNPPYVRLEDIPAELRLAYRAECPTMRGRADIYVGFFEKGLSMLSPGGKLAFICADRWMHNQYGKWLRSLVSSDYAVDTIANVHAVDAFEDMVSAYPAITILRNGRQGPIHVVQAKAGFDEVDGRALVRWLANAENAASAGGRFDAVILDQWFTGGDHWPSGSSVQLELIAELEERFEPLEDRRTGTRIGIGVATGCDDVFVVEDATGVERCRLLPLLTAQDVTSGTPQWSGRFLVNPWDEGNLVDLEAYPGLASYFEHHRNRLGARHVARKRPGSWYRTIDRVDPDLLARPKLLLPDLKSAAHPVLDNGGYYPHHNLYFVVSDKWDLEVLGGLLLSDITNLFVGAYCVKMRGGTYRFQAQYLRKIRVPSPDAIDATTATALSRAFKRRDRDAATDAAAALYGIRRADLLCAAV